MYHYKYHIRINNIIQELVTALHGLVIQYEREFQIAALRSSDGDGRPTNLSTSLAPGGWINVFIDPTSEDNNVERNQLLFPNNKSGSVFSNGQTSSISGGSYSSDGESSDGDDTVPRLGPHTQSYAPPPPPLPVRRFHDTSSNRNIYTQIWRSLQLICSDPCPSVALKAGQIIQSVHDKVNHLLERERVQ